MLELILLCNVISGTFPLTVDELAAFQPRIEGYIDPNTGKQAEVYAWDSGKGYQMIKTNGIPSHHVGVFPKGKPPELKEVVTELRIYSNPVMRDKPLKCLPLNFVGIATSGTVINSWFHAMPGCVDIERDSEQFDICAGHPSPSSQYHYSFYSPCVQIPVCGKPSPIYGVSIDGIPIYGPISEDGLQLTNQDLDECGGRWDKDGRYKYHVTVDPPYFMACFMGEIRSDIGKSDDDFVCSCPYDDSMFSTARPPDLSKTPHVCSSSNNGSLAMSCWDDEYLSEYLKELPYKVPYLWEYQDKEISLIACCPQGVDCGNSCETEHGTKYLCFQEKKTVTYLTRVAKYSNSVPINVTWVVLVLNLILNLNT